MSNSENKRKFPRVEGKGVGAYLRLNGHNAGCTVHNISVGGVFVRTDRFLPVGTKLAFDLVKPGMKKALTVTGWVVGVITQELSARTKLPQGLRIQFAKLNPVASDALQELVGSLRRNPGAEPPVLYPMESKADTRAPARRPSGSKRSLVPAPPRRAPSRALGDEPPNSTEVEMEARRESGDGEEDYDLAHRSSDDRPMIDDSLIDAAGDPDVQEDDAEEPEGHEEFEEEANPFDDQDQTIGAEPTHARARFPVSPTPGAAAKRPTAPRPPPSRVRPAAQDDEWREPAPPDEEPSGEGTDEGDERSDVDDLESNNQELQRLLQRREGEINALRAQVAKLEQSLKEKDEQLQLAKRILKTNGLG